ncbi:YidC/Oxa1 family membrane protein insertase [Alkalibacter rhizosphaerae]|uniref:YidC/Oxa1 family membrane protein insertase n=1 Tax=Alkalibacter rhizosphaerae TaxID=2815577 RepID=A0A975AIY2_9FIRM|nr:YidC/Oxa1 family membrane protein insertase [Alkalibacter rhizosphaerae]QSX09144.1 YidC/Oxa1 family membrane protein insertase [Alkalibacter rhizosphaerae]
MDSILNFFGMVLLSVYNVFQPFALTIVMYAVLIRILFIVVFTKYFANIKLGPALQPEIDKMNKKFKNNPERRNQELPALLISKGYSLVGNIVNFVIHALFGLGLSLTLLQADKFLTISSETIPMMLFNLPLNLSPADVMFSGVYPSNYFLYAAVFFLTATGLHAYIDKIMEKRSLLDTKKPDTVILLLVTIGCFVLPLGFSIFWFIVKTLDLVHIMLVDKFYKVNLDKINKLKAPIRKKAK